MKWELSEAVALCVELEAIAPKFGAHVALTGGTLYKPGARKDLDVLFYRIRQVGAIDVEGLFAALKKVGIERGPDFGWCAKASYQGKPIDFFFPERVGGPQAPDGAYV